MRLSSWPWLAQELAATQPVEIRRLRLLGAKESEKSFCNGEPFVLQSKYTACYFFGYIKFEYENKIKSPRKLGDIDRRAVHGVGGGRRTGNMSPPTVSKGVRVFGVVNYYIK